MFDEQRKKAKDIILETDTPKFIFIAGIWIWLVHFEIELINHPKKF